jgi:hypothetical protein
VTFCGCGRRRNNTENIGKKNNNKDNNNIDKASLQNNVILRGRFKEVANGALTPPPYTWD